MRNDRRLVLMVEDDNKLREVLTKFLSRNDYEVLAAENGKVGLELFYENSKNLDIVLLDGMLPDIDGVDVLKEIREHSQVPVINNGADNYITKPFLMKVLLVHMDKLIQRNGNEDTDVIEKGALRLEKQFRKAYINGEFVDTTPKEFDLLVYMCENEKVVLKRENILDAVWGFDYDGDMRTVDTLVKQLRKKMTDKYPYITSVYGVGYRFEVK